MGCTASTVAAGHLADMDMGAMCKRPSFALGRLRSGDDATEEESHSDKGESDPRSSRNNSRSSSGRGNENSNRRQEHQYDAYANLLSCGDGPCRSTGRRNQRRDSKTNDIDAGTNGCKFGNSHCAVSYYRRDLNRSSTECEQRRPQIRTVGCPTSQTCADIAIGDEDREEKAFSSRRWLPAAAEIRQFDMNELHDAEPPFLGSMYWTAVAPPAEPEPAPPALSCRSKGPHELYPCHRVDLPSLITPSPRASPPRASPPRNSSFGIQEDVSPSTKKQHGHPSKASLDSACSWTETTTSSYNEDDSDHEDNFDAMNMSLNQSLNMSMNLDDTKGTDTSRDLLNYSTAVDDSFISHQSHDPALEIDEELQRNISPHAPRRLFDIADDIMEDEYDFEEADRTGVSPCTPQHQPPQRSLITDSPQVSAASSARAMFRATDACRYLRPAAPAIAIVESNTHGGNEAVIIRSGVMLRGREISSDYAADVSTFAGAFGSRRERHVTTLPSQITGKPIRLRITESASHGVGSMGSWGGMGGARGGGHGGVGPGHDHDDGDMFSYDPYFSSGKYHISTSDGRPYGNGLAMKMGSSSPFMTLQDGRGEALAAARSRHTWAPSHVIYAPKPRYPGQKPSGHRLSKITSATAPGEIAGAASFVESVVESEAEVRHPTRDEHDYYNGRKAQHLTLSSSTDKGDRLYPWALVQKAGRTMEDEASVHFVDEGSGRFKSRPAYRGRHGFDDFGLHTHTILSRVIAGDEQQGGSGEREVPCCIILRDPTDVDSFDVTIAPGIDPMLMICYLAAHSKMDVEPIFGGF